MRWTAPHKVGDTKVFTYFAFFPVTIDGETRWLEKVSVLKQYSHLILGNVWINLYFMDTDVTEINKLLNN